MGVRREALEISAPSTQGGHYCEGLVHRVLLCDGSQRSSRGFKRNVIDIDQCFRHDSFVYSKIDQ